jgi:hypothetical protein
MEQFLSYIDFLEDNNVIETIEIKSKDGSYALDPTTLNIFNVNDAITINNFNSKSDDENIDIIGTLIEVEQKYSQIKYENKYYIIAKEILDNNKELYLCIESNRVFDKSKKYYGILKIKKKELYIKYNK